jgi:uncharacterized protein (DUF433 family)
MVLTAMQAVVIYPETSPGTPVFRGTTVPVRKLFEEIESGGRLEDFLESFPVVSRNLAIEALEEVKLSLVDAAEVVAPAASVAQPNENGQDPEGQWLHDHREHYRGQWVALDGYKLISHGEDGKKVFRDAIEAGVQCPFMEYIEVERLPFAGF